MEDLQWILREVVERDGDASICRASFVDGLTDAEIEGLFLMRARATTRRSPLMPRRR